MLDLNGLFVVGGALLSVILLCSLVFTVRPALARQRLEIEGGALRDNLVDAYFRGEIPESDKDQLRNLLEYVDCVVDGVVRFTYVETLLLRRLLIQEGIRIDRGDKLGRTSIVGRAERQFDAMVWRYMITASKIWFILEPVRYVRRLLGKRHRNSRSNGAMARPSEIATGLREAVEGDRGCIVRSAVLQAAADDAPLSTTWRDHDSQMLVGAAR